MQLYSSILLGDCSDLEEILWKGLKLLLAAVYTLEGRGL